MTGSRLLVRRALLATLTVVVVACGSSGPSAASPPGPTPSVGSGATPVTSASIDASPSPEAAASPSSSPTPTPAGPLLFAPAGFQPRATVIPMGFPFRHGIKVTFGDGWGALRVEPVLPYNMIYGQTANGTLIRAHDGLDLRVPIGTLVLSPFDGTVVDPTVRWIPWAPDRYGTVVAIRSDEPGSDGFVVILAHLSGRRVRPGDQVRRGEVVGLTGISGNAGGTIPHLHVEIRAPFLIRYRVRGVARVIDAFDIGPSILAAMRRVD
jgi:murein DD-endopeptidase MepM/ murein hydrolase activator NlpD